MKRNLFLSAILMMVSLWSYGQRLDITLEDNSVVSYDVKRIKSLEFMPESLPGQISGYWYLGWRIMTSSQTHYDGDEKWIFNGTVMKQIDKNGNEKYFDLEYAEDMKSFRAEPREPGIASTYNIVAKEDGLLVLKVGSTSRQFYNSVAAAHDAISPIPYPSRNEYTDTTKVWALKTSSSHSNTSPMGNHYAKYAAATQEQIEWLANPANQPEKIALVDCDASFDRWTAKSITLYPLNGGNPTPADVNQHAIGDCSMCAVFASFAYIYPDFIKSIITQKSTTSFVVKMFDPQGNPIDVAVDNKLLCKSNGECAQVSGKNGKFNWATIMEKALIKWLDCFSPDKDHLLMLGGIGTEHAAPPFTGDGDSWAINSGKLYNGELTMIVDYALKNGMISVGGFNKGDLLCGTLKTVTGHAFTAMYTRYPDKYCFSMRNPWGIESVDGVLEIPDKREIMNTIDFRLVMPGAAAPYKRQDLGGYIPPKFTMGKYDRVLSPEMLKMYKLESYGNAPAEDEEEITDEE